MTTLHFAMLVAFLAGSHASQPKLLTGTFNDRLVPEDGRAVIELRLSDAQGIPGVAQGGRVFRVSTPQFRPGNARDGLLVAFVETKDGGLLFVDANLDGRLTESERSPYTPASNYAAQQELQIDISLGIPGVASLPFRCRVLKSERGGELRYSLHFTASFRAEGYVDIGGIRTLVSLPFDTRRGTVNVARGRIGIDANNDGTVTLEGVLGPEVRMAKGERVIMRVGERYVSFDSADFAARSFVMREHTADEYTYIEVRVGAPLPDFAFTDFEGKARKLSDFRGKHLLLDFWGSWCGPCVADVPMMKAAYERFRDRGFEILGIDYEHGASVDRVRKLLQEKGATWTNATPESVKDLVENRFRIWGFPTLILLDPDGVVVETNAGRLRGQSLIATLEKTLKK